MLPIDRSKNKLFQVWLTNEEMEKVKEFLDKFSAGDSEADQRRHFMQWLGKQTEGIDQRLLDQQIQKKARGKESQRVSLSQRSHARLAAQYSARS